jgi:hypothetical protein
MKFIKYIFAVLALALGMAACDPVDQGGELKIKTDKLYIQANGKDVAKLTVTQGEKDITEKVQFYQGTTPITLTNGQFTTTTTGTFEIWAEYNAEITEKITLTALAVAVPETPADPQPQSTSFKRRILLTQFTGTGCKFCPAMKTTIKEVLSDETVGNKVVKTAAHTFNSSDPAYLESPLDDAMGISNYPWVVFDMAYGFNNSSDKKGMTDKINSIHAAQTAKAGISVNSVIKDGVLVAKVAVKGAEDTDLRIGAWLLEDGINGKQTAATEDWHNTHNECIRLADSKVSSINFSGHRLGRLAKGKVAEHVFVMNLDPSWKVSNLHLAVFVTAANDKGEYIVNNVIDCPANGVTPYDYL